MDLEEIVVPRKLSILHDVPPTELVSQTEKRCMSRIPEILHSNIQQEWKAVFDTVDNNPAEAKKEPIRPNNRIRSLNHTKRNKGQRWRFRLNKDLIPVSFLSETSIHGLKYIAQENRHWFERLFWLISFVLGVLSSGYLIHGVWDRYNKTPVIVTFDANWQSNTLIPFPAVTICNDNFVSERKIYEIERVLVETSPSDPKHLEALKKLIALLSAVNKPYVELLEFYKQKLTPENRRVVENNNLDFNIFIQDTVPCDEIIRECVFGGFLLPCAELFEPIITSYGKCCTFNSLPPQLLFQNLTEAAKPHWPQDELDRWASGVPEKLDALDPNISYYRPRLQMGTGQNHGLTIIIAPDIDGIRMENLHSDGVRFMLHSAFEIPRISEFASVAHMGKENLVEIRADMTKADADIRSFQPEKRKCVFPNERELHSFTHYTRENCIEECKAVYLNKLCGCTTSMLAHYEAGLGGRICNEQDKACVVQGSVCDGCEPLCEEIKYSQQMTMSNLKSRLWSHVPLDQRPIWANSNSTVMRIYFGSDRPVPKLRKALYGMEDLIANTGGILGLCLGFSILSGIELAYFVTLRAIFQHCGEWHITWSRVSRALTSTLEGVFKSKTRVVSLDGNSPPVEEGTVTVNNGGWI